MLHILLRAEHHYIISEEIPVEVEVTNTGNISSLFHIPTTASGQLIYDFFSLVLNNSTEVLYHGMLVKSRCPLTSCNW